MNIFSVNGIVRDRPSEILLDGEPYLAFTIVQDSGKFILPVYAKGEKLTKRIKRLAIIGTSVEINGKIATTYKYYEGKVYVRVFFVIEKFTRTAAPKIQFRDNIVIEKILALNDTEDLLKVFRRKGKSKDDK